MGEELRNSFGHLPSQTTGCSMQGLSNQQQFANSLAALLLRKHGLSSADALLGASSAAASRSGSPYIAGQDANNATGALLEAGALQLPAAAKPLSSSTTPLAVARLRVQQHNQHCDYGGPACAGDSQCSHNSVVTEDAVLATPSRAVNLFTTVPRLASPSPLGQLAAQPAAVPSAAAGSPAAATPQQVSGSPAAAPAAPASAAPLPKPHVPAATAGSAKSWLYQLVTCPYLFKPCPQCAPTHTGREVLITYFDPDEPGMGYCTYCSQRASKPRLLQIRRSTYHEVVKAADVSRLADVSGIQHYVINGAKVLFLRPRPQPRPPKGVVAPARCAVDGRQLMDAHSSYCSLRCKLEVEDKIFADNYPSAAEEMEAAAQGAEVGDVSTMGLAGTYHRQGGHEGRRVVVPSHKRSTAAIAPASDSHLDEGSSEEGDVGDHKRAKRQRNMPSKFANTVLGSIANYQSAGASAPSRSHQQHHNHQQRPHHSKAPELHFKQDDTVSDQLINQGLDVAGLAATAQVFKEQVSSPCASEDSARSSTCNQRWHHKRKVMQPCRAPLQ